MPRADKLPSREELLSGRLSCGRRAAKLLSAIEERCLYLRDESRRIVTAYLLEGDEDFKRRMEASLSRPTQLIHS